LGLYKQYGKKDSEVSQFLKSATACVGILIQFSERKASGTVLQLPARKYYYADSNFPLPVWFECTASSLRTINACELFHAHFNALFYIAHHNIFVLVSALQKIQNETYIKIRGVTTGGFKKSATFKNEDLNLLKNWTV
jgi:hypothetical protein